MKKMTDETSRLLLMMEQDPDPEKRPDWLVQMGEISEEAYAKGLQAYYAIRSRPGYHKWAHPKAKHFEKYPIVAANTILETLIHAESAWEEWEFMYCKEIVYDLVAIARLPQFSNYLNQEGVALQTHPIMRLLIGYLGYMEAFQPKDHPSIKWGAYALVSCCPEDRIIQELLPSFGQKTWDWVIESRSNYPRDLGGRRRLYTLEAR
jgi:hypothetical protein